MAREPYVSVNLSASRAGHRVSQKDIVEQLSQEITSGRLRPAMRLPPVRALEHQLGISKNTAQAAYDELVARGLLEARLRQGVFVAVPAEGVVAAPLRHPSAPRLVGPDLPRPQPVRLERLELSNVFIDPELLPHAQLSDCFRSVLANPGLHTFYDAQGHPALREVIAERLRARGIEASPDDVIVTAGSQQALDIVARSLEHKVVATENPVYSLARQLFLHLGCRLVPLRLDPFRAVDLGEWEAMLVEQRPSLVYLISSYQNPTGYSYSSAELERLLELSERHGFAILEDDWGSDMLSCSEYRPTLRALGGPNVLYVNSFTKKLLPSLRLGYLLCSAATRDALVAAKRVATLGNATLMEATLHEFISRGYYDAHLRRIHGLLDQRYLACLDLLRDWMPPGVRFSTPGGGPTLWLDLPRSIGVPELSERMASRGVFLERAEGHFYGEPHLNGFRVGFAFLSVERLQIGLRALAEELALWAPSLPSARVPVAVPALSVRS
jgi:GntR family transcriptional regulator/MocR family aminotransferase